MATTITAGNSTNGAAISSDNTGALDIKTGTGAGTLALNINASQTVTIPGNLVVAGTATVGGVPVGGNYVSNAYTSPTSWDVNTKKAAGLKAVKVTIIGGGGAGGGVPTSTGTQAGGGGGGGGGTIYYAPSSTLTPSPTGIAITAGPGTNSFGGFCSATGGSAGGPSSPPGTLQGAGGASGTGSGGYIIVSGTAGFTAPTTNNGGEGGNGALLVGLFGAPSNPRPGAGAGGVGFSAVSTNYGGGGGGAAKSSPNATPYAGGAGAPGVVIIEEFY
jgi:hypothetical protein